MLVFIYINLSECIFADLTCHCDCQDGHARNSTGCVAHGQRLCSKELRLYNISYLILYITFDI